MRLISFHRCLWPRAAATWEVHGGAKFSRFAKSKAYLHIQSKILEIQSEEGTSRRGNLVKFIGC